MESTASGYIGRIPVRNLWLLMLYASDLYRELGSTIGDAEDNPDDIPDLVAEMLARAVERRLKRCLSFGYRRQKKILSRIRGRVDFVQTESRQLLQRGKVACLYDELCVDTPRNRSVRAALLRLSKICRNARIRTRCASLAARLREAGVTGDTPGRRELSLETFGRHDFVDRQMVYLARLAFDLALPNETPGSRSIPAPEREEHWIRKLFERAVGGFYSHVLDPRIWNVRTGEFLFWPISRKSSLIDDIMPSMKTDIILENIDTQSRIIIDTKFTEIVESGWYRDDSLKSKYLYQIYAYLRSQEKADDEYSSHATGILIHPAVGAEYNEFVELQDHTLRFITVDLAGKASKFREQLLIATPRQNLLNLEKSSVRN